VALDLLASSVDYDDRFRAEVEKSPGKEES
jgi:hypothetical protein